MTKVTTVRKSEWEEEREAVELAVARQKRAAVYLRVFSWASRLQGEGRPAVVALHEVAGTASVKVRGAGWEELEVWDREVEAALEALYPSTQRKRALRAVRG